MTNESNVKNEENNLVGLKETLNKFIKQFRNESDRAAVILSIAVIEELLIVLLKSFFVPTPSGEDKLFDTGNAPLGTFSSKIDISYRIGLISSQFTRDLHLIRKIRNAFAHNIEGCDFQNGSVSDRVTELRRSHAKLIEGLDYLKGENINRTREVFMVIVATMIGNIKYKVETITSLSSPDLEKGYSKGST